MVYKYPQHKKGLEMGWEGGREGDIIYKHCATALTASFTAAVGTRPSGLYREVILGYKWFKAGVTVMPSLLLLLSCFVQESWDYIGSSRMVYDMEQGEFPSEPSDDKEKKVGAISSWITHTHIKTHIYTIHLYVHVYHCVCRKQFYKSLLLCYWY